MTDPTPHFHRFGLAPDRVVILLPAQTVNPAACWRSRGRLAHSLRIERNAVAAAWRTSGCGSPRASTSAGAAALAAGPNRPSPWAAAARTAGVRSASAAINGFTAGADPRQGLDRPAAGAVVAAGQGLFQLRQRRRRRLPQRAGGRPTHVGVVVVQRGDQGRHGLVFPADLAQGDGRLIGRGVLSIAKQRDQGRQGLGMLFDLPQGQRGGGADAAIRIVQGAGPGQRRCLCPRRPGFPRPRPNFAAPR